MNQFQYPMLSHGDLTFCLNGNIPIDVSPPALELTSNPLVGAIKPWNRYLVSVAPNASNRVEYPSTSGIYYYTGDVFVGVASGVGILDTATFTGTAQARPCTTKNKYTKINASAFSGNRVENAIPLKTAFWDYKDPAVSSHNKGYWSSEKYRFGILFFDNKGNPFYVKYIKDITMLDIPTKGGLMRPDSYSVGSPIYYSLNPSAVKLSGLDIPESVMNQISGFSIVRAERDPIVITQGLLMQNVLDPTPPSANNRIMPLGVTRTDFSKYDVFYSDQGSLCSCVCPDWLVGYTPTSVSNNYIGKIGSKLKEAFWLKGDTVKTNTDWHSFLTKMFLHQVPDGQSRTMNLRSMNGVGIRGFDEYNGDSNIIGTNQNFYNRDSDVYATKLNNDSDYTCSVKPDYFDFDVQSVGCKKFHVMPNNFNHYGSSSSYTWSGSAEKNNYNKIVVNFLTDSDPATLYGGVSDSAISDTLYISCGHFQPINAQVKADTLNGAFGSGKYVGENKYTFNDIEIFGGDCFTNLIDINYGLWNTTYFNETNAMAYTIWFPCEGNVNYNLRRGRKVSNVGVYPDGVASKSIVWDGLGTLGGTRLEDYSYNKGYSTDGNFIKYPALPLFYKFTGKFEYRMRWAGQKYPGELINSFRNFRLPDYRDLDGQRGQINNVKTRDSKLIYWQDHSVGSVPILERQLVGGSALGDATSLGVTGVIDRFDDIDTYVGNQHQHGLVETEYGFAWFDMRRRAFMVMGIGTKPNEMSMAKGLQVFFNEEFNEGDLTSGVKLYNTNDLSAPEQPLMGYGIVGCYDPTFKMTYMTFKYKKHDLISSPDNLQSTVNKDFTLGYSHILNAFVSFIDNCPSIWHNHNDLVLTANNPKATVTYDSYTPDFTEYKIGDTIPLEGTEYICISPVTIDYYPGTLGAGGTNPLEPTSTFWAAINKTNEIYLQNFGAELCKFYGKVHEHSIEVVVNAKSDAAVSPQNIQFKAVGANWTDVVASTDDQSASDLNISTTSRNYRYIDKSWFSSLPLPTNGRLVDYYVKLKFTYKNYVTDPRVAKNVQKISQWLKTFFVVRR